MLSILYYIFTLLQVTVLFIVSIIVLALTYPFDKSRRWVHECSRLICALLYGVPPFIRRTIDGVENIDPKKAYVMVMNHNSGFDIFAAYKIPLNFRWVSKREVFRVPFMGPLLTIHGDIPIERGNATKAMAKVLRLGKLWISRGATIAIFPEGTRSKTGEINRFKAGAFTLAKEAGVEILPVVMTGTNEFFRKGWLVNWRNRVAIRVLKPVSVEEVAAKEVAELSTEVRERMVLSLAELRKEVATEKR
ncbi:MAG: 1-acyl-sn-glycerol-3-phosphate acyltransferase [Rikenellaceae bacterium]|nr:1-acyl-sn-glycerol-3-phosphate acyltransferase [Rikenellaceae bacterium]